MSYAHTTRNVTAALAALVLAAVSAPADAEAAKFRFRMPNTGAKGPTATATPDRMPVAGGVVPYVATRAAIAGASVLVGRGSADADGKGPVYAIAGEQPPLPAPPPQPKSFRERWADFCKPTLAPPDRWGIERWTYAHEGCQFGRTE